MLLLIVLIFSLVLILPASATDFSDEVVNAEDMTVDETILENQKIELEDMENINSDDSEELMATSSSTYDYDSILNGKSDVRSFTSLQEKISNASKGSTVNLEYDYEYDSGFTVDGIKIEKDEITINGNGHTIDALNKARVFNITGGCITISNLNIINGFSEEDGGAIFFSIEDAHYLNNVTFINNYAKQGGAIYFKGQLTVEGCAFDKNTAIEYGGSIRSVGDINISNSNFTNGKSKYSAAIHVFKELDPYSGIVMVSIENCTFENLSAEESAGALGVKNFAGVDIINCNFTNTSSKRNGGAVVLDPFKYPSPVNIENSTFINSSAGYGGALAIFNADLNIDNCEFINNIALYEGGAIYVSWSDANIVNTTIIGNKLIHDDYGRGGGIYFDYSTANVTNCTIINNTNGIFSYDKELTVENTTFADNGEAIHGVFLDYEFINVDTGNDTLCLNNTDYFSVVSGSGNEIILLNNTIDVATLPSRYDSRDWGWVTPVRKQGDTGYCWAFGTCAALEVSLLKATGIAYNVSVNNMAKMMIQYSKYGILDKFEGGFDQQGMEYILSWLGVFPEEYDTYDELGKISRIISTDENVHIVDAIIIGIRKNSTDNDALKRAILKCGAVTIGIEDSLGETYLYQNDSDDTSHQVCIVGWDDNFPASKFPEAPPGDGAFIIKNSMGKDYADNGYNYISYYDTSILNTSGAVGFLIENTENYIRNYQYDLSGLTESFENNGSLISYRNTYQSLGNELISAVGTYFNESEDYVLEIYVNDKLVHTQNGTAPFNGYHTVKLTKAISIAMNDTFTVVMSKDSLIMFKNSRQHYINGTSQYLVNGIWVNASDNDRVCCLKAYAVVDDSNIVNNENISVDYGEGEYFSVKVVNGDGPIVAGASVEFTINNRTIPVKTDGNGIAKIKITDVPGTYVITTVCNGKTYNNTVTVKLNLDSCKVTENKNINVDYDGGSYFSVNVVSDDGKVAAVDASVKFTINGKTTEVKTDKNGIAKIQIIDVPGTYAMTTTFNGKTYNNTVTVKQVLKANKVQVKKTAKKFSLKATLKINGKVVKGKWVTFKFNGKTYKVKTNSKGIAQKTFKNNVIKKLKKGKTYTVKVIYLKDTIKTTVKVK